MKVKVLARELIDPDVQHLSLVEGGANRQPIKICKEDREMIDMSNFPSIFKKEEKNPEILAVLVKKSADGDGVRKFLSDQGLEVDCPQDVDDVTVAYIQKGEAQFDKENDIVIQSSDDLAFAITNVQKGYDVDWGGEEFKAAANEKGIYPGLHASLSLLNSIISEEIKKAETPEGMADSIAAALEGFNNYVSGLLNEVPVLTLKTEQITLPEETPEVADATEEVKKEDTSEEPAVEEEVKKEETPEDAGEAASEESTEEGSDEPAEEDSDEVVEVEKAEAPADDKVLKMIEALTESITSLQNDFKNEVGGISERLQKAEKSVAEANSAISGTVLGSAASDPSGRETVKKHEGEPPLMDTGMLRFTEQGE